MIYSVKFPILGAIIVTEARGKPPPGVGSRMPERQNEHPRIQRYKGADFTDRAYESIPRYAFGPCRLR
jgi:hypothetical protein